MTRQPAHTPPTDRSGRAMGPCGAGAGTTAGRRLKAGLRRRLAHALYATPLYRLMLKGRHPHGLTAAPVDPWPGDANVADAMFQGRYCFRGEEVSSPREAPWEPDGASDAWLTDFHGFGWLRHFTAQGGEAARRHAQALVDSWLRRYPDWHPLAWRPDIIGRRLIALACHAPLVIINSELTYRSRVLDSMARQARHLTRSIDLAAPGPARLDAIVGLIYAGFALPDARRRLGLGVRLLEQELAIQVLGDGCHISRNPSTHLAVLQDLVMLRDGLAGAGYEVPLALQNAIDRMTPMLRFFRHGDGGLALFNGGIGHADGDVDLTLALAGARGKPVTSATHAGYERIVRQRTVLLMDVGAPPLPESGNAGHAGLLAFELSAGKHRIVVNCGAPIRSDAAWQAAMRATAAHSTLTVADENQFEIAGPRGSLDVSATRQDVDGQTLIVAQHTGYRARHGVTHGRRLYMEASGNDLRGEDRLAVDAPRPGRRGGRHETLSWAVRFHLHPAVKASLQDGGGVLLKPLAGDGWRFIATGGTVALEESIYLGDGEPVRSRQITISGRCDGEDETVIRWALRRMGTSQPAAEDEPVLPGLDF